jgi:hypothetical protein
MAEKITEHIIFKKEVEIVITPQAQKIIATSKYSIEEFKNWSLQDQKISLGGNNATIFLEKMYDKEVNE